MNEFAIAAGTVIVIVLVGIILALIVGCPALLAVTIIQRASKRRRNESIRHKKQVL